LTLDRANDGMINAVSGLIFFSWCVVIVVTWKNVKLGAGVKIEKGDAPENENVEEEVKIIKKNYLKISNTFERKTRANFSILSIKIHTFCCDAFEPKFEYNITFRLIS
jgi:hypothetical protein